MRNRAAISVLAALAVLFAAGVFRLLWLRFDAGDVYPPYSSLRRDPLGTRALYDGLSGAGWNTERALGNPDEIPIQPAFVLFHIGEDPRYGAWREDERRAFLFRTAAAGNRVVLAFHPVKSESDAPTRPDALRERGPERDDRPGPTNRTASAGGGPAALRRQWGFEWFVDTREGKDLPDTARRSGSAPPGWPDRLALRTRLRIENPDEHWRVLYRVDGRPVAISRDVGRGQIVVVADSYPFSNEAMRDARPTALLADLARPYRRAVFDESHLGLGIEPGFGDLARRYGLSGFLAGLAALAALFVWSLSAPLRPRDRTRRDDDAVVTGRDSASGLSYLLRRHLPPGDALEACVTSWLEAPPDDIPAARRQRAADAWAAVKQRGRDPANAPELYRTLQRAISGKDKGT